MSGSRLVLVLNADFRPLNWYPLSVCTWQDAVKALFMGRADVVMNSKEKVHSPSLSMHIPSVIVLKRWIMPQRYPPFTRRNLLLRDMYNCQYCGKDGQIFGMRNGPRLTLDHIYPRSKGGHKSWLNIVASCPSCNTKKRDRTPEEAKMPLLSKPHQPSMKELWENSRNLTPQGHIPEEWKNFLIPQNTEDDEEFEIS